MARNQRLVVAQHHCRVAAVSCLDLPHGFGRQVFEKHSSVNLRLNDVVIYFVAQVGMRAKETGAFHGWATSQSRSDHRSCSQLPTAVSGSRNSLTLPPPALESYRSGAPQAKIQLTNSRARHSCSAARPLYAPGFDIFQGANG